MLKNLLTISPLTFMISMFLITTASAPSSTRLYNDPLTISDTSAGETFTVQVNVADVTDLTVFGFNLSYNTNTLDVVSSTVTPPSAWGSNYLVLGNSVNENTGVYWVAVAKTGAAPSFSGSTSLATVTFEATTSRGASNLDLRGTGLADSQYQEISHIIICAGDVDRDGDVDKYDFGMFAQAYGPIGNPLYNPNADFNNDGDVDKYEFGSLAQNYGKRCGCYEGYCGLQ